jgi:ABC-2 type transport system ATP-binding protein
VLRVEELSRRYGEKRGVNAVSFTLSRGQVLGFPRRQRCGQIHHPADVGGRSGAGRRADYYQWRFDLLDQPRQAKQAIGYLPEQPPLYYELTVDEQLYYSARLHRLDRVASRQAMTRTKELCGLVDVDRRLIGNLSKGYRQRVGIAQAMLHNPSVLILDEPTVGLDPIQGRQIRDLIRELGQDRGVILSTHLLAEVQTTCTDVQIMQCGQLVYSGALTDLRLQRQSSRLRIRLNAPPLVAELARLPMVTQVEDLGGGQFRLHHAVGVALHRTLIEHAQASGWDLWEMTPEPAGLEQICIELMLGQETVA